MGIPKSRSLRTHTPIISSMKFLVILALAVAVSAEADPQLMYNTYGAGWPITSYVQKPLVSTYVKPVVYTHGIKTPTYSNDAITPFGYAAKGQYRANSAGVVHVAKREAEADAQMILPVTTYGHSLVHPTQSVVYKQAVQPVVYKQAVQPVIYTKPVVPLVYNTPIVQKVQPVNYMAGSYADDSVKPFDYAAKGKYMANSAGTIHKAKREAEADPALVYSSGIIPTTYTSGIYNTAGIYNAGIYSTGLTHLGYPTTYHYGKREAEAEPQYYGYNGIYNSYYRPSAYTYSGLRTYGYPYGRTFW